MFIPSFHNYRIWSFLGLGMTTYTAWYLAIAALIHGQVLLINHHHLSRVYFSESVFEVMVLIFYIAVSKVLCGCFFFFVFFIVWRSGTLSSNKASAVFYWRHQHPLHLWRTCCYCVSFLPPYYLLLLHFFLHGFCLQLLPVISDFETTDKIMQTTFACLGKQHYSLYFPFIFSWRKKNSEREEKKFLFFAAWFSCLQIDYDAEGSCLHFLFI